MIRPPNASPMPPDVEVTWRRAPDVAEEHTTVLVGWRVWDRRGRRYVLPVSWAGPDPLARHLTGVALGIDRCEADVTTAYVLQVLDSESRTGPGGSA